MPSKTPRATRTDEQKQDTTPAKAKRTGKGAGAELTATVGQDSTQADTGAEQPRAEADPGQDAPQGDAGAVQTQADNSPAQDAPQADAGGTFTMRIYNPGDLIPDPEIDSRDEAEYSADDPEMVELVGSMKATAENNPEGVGNNQAILVRSGEPGGPDRIVAGRRRNTAAGIAGVRVIAIVRPMSLKDARIAALVENVDRKSISFLAEARQYHVLATEHGMSQREIAAAMKGKTERSQAAISKALTVYRMPQWVHALIQAGKLGPDVAYEAFKVFAQVPGEDKAPGALAGVWMQMEKAWKTIAAHGTPTAARLKEEAGLIVKRASRSLDATYTINGEEAPAFDRTTHDEACTCGGPAVQVNEYHRKHARCFAPEVWEKVQATAKQARTDALRTPAARFGSSATPRASTGAPQAQSAPAPAAAPQGTATEAPQAGEPQEARSYAEPTWAEFAQDFTPHAGGLVLTREFTPAEGAVPAPLVLADWTLVPADSIRFVQAPTTPGAFRLVCTDPEALRAARSAGEDGVQRMVDLMRGQRQAALRETAAKTDLHTAEAFAALLWAHEKTDAGFPAETAEMLGIELPDSLPALAGMKKSQLALVHQAIVARVLVGDTDYHVDETEEEARRQVSAVYAQHFASRVAGFPLPVRLEAPHEGAPAPVPADGEQPVEASQEGAPAPAPADGEQPVEAPQEGAPALIPADGEQPVEAPQEGAPASAPAEGEQPVESRPVRAAPKPSQTDGKGGKSGKGGKGRR